MNSQIKRGVAALTAVLLVGAVQAQGGLRPEVGKPLQAAQELIKAGKYREALAKVHELDGIGGKSTSENLMVERMRLAAASGAGDADTAAKSFETVGASVSGADKRTTAPRSTRRRSSGTSATSAKVARAARIAR
jgi:hypothetical protein